MTPASWRSAALVALWLQVASVFGVAAYALAKGNFSGVAWINAVEAFMAGLVLVWWTVLLGRLTAGQAVAEEDGTRWALRVAFPWLTSFRLVLWFMTLLAVLNGAGEEANSVALTALLTVWPAAVLASNAVYGTVVRLVPNPPDAVGHRRLADWLNLAAALSLAMAVFNVVPIPGFSSDVTLTDQLVYGLGGLLDVAATLLAMRAVQTAPGARG